MLKRTDTMYVHHPLGSDDDGRWHIVNGFGFRSGKTEFCYTLCELDYTLFDVLFSGVDVGDICPDCLTELRKIGTLGKGDGDGK